MKFLVLFLLPVEINADDDIANDEGGGGAGGRQQDFRPGTEAPAAGVYDFDATAGGDGLIDARAEAYAAGIHILTLQFKADGFDAAHQSQIH